MNIPVLILVFSLQNKRLTAYSSELGYIKVEDEEHEILGNRNVTCYETWSNLSKNVIANNCSTNHQTS